MTARYSQLFFVGVTGSEVAYQHIGNKRMRVLAVRRVAAMAGALGGKMP
jgi:hypothetical protein